MLEASRKSIRTTLALGGQMNPLMGFGTKCYHLDEFIENILHLQAHENFYWLSGFRESVDRVRPETDFVSKEYPGIGKKDVLALNQW